MQTFKTAVVVVLLLVVFYGVYEMLNRPPDEAPEDVQRFEDIAFEPPDIDFGEMDGPGFAPPTASVPPFETPVGPATNAPPVSVPPPPSEYGTLPPSTPGQPNVSPRAEFPGPGQQLTVEFPADNSMSPPGVSPTPGSVTSGPPAANTSSPFPAPPAGSPVQQNPFFAEDIVSNPSGAGGGAQSEQVGVRAYERALKLARSQVNDGDYHAALRTLSIFYRSQDLSTDEHRSLLDLLDPLAGRVIYSGEHLVEPAYRVRRNEKLSDIASQYEVPVQLLQNINGVENPDVLVPGTELKVVSGPFRADVDLQNQELTIFLDQLYAGRFPITLGQDPEPIEGDFFVRDKQRDKAFYSLGGPTIPAGSPANPFGNAWLDLGREVCIHGSPLGATQQQRGCISLSPRDADDVYSILSVGSRVRVLR